MPSRLQQNWNRERNLTLGAPSGRGRGLTLVELMVAVALSGVVMLPIAIFMVQMTKASTSVATKMMLSSRILSSTLTMRIAVFKASQAEVRLNGNGVAIGTAGNELHFATGANPINQYIKRVGDDLVINDGNGERILIHDVAAFSVTETQNGGYTISLQLVSEDNQTSCTLKTEVLLFNADTQ